MYNTAKEKKFVLYVHIFPNNKMYIGITCTDPIKRWSYGNGYRRQPLMWKAIQKYGWDNIKHKVLYKNLDYEVAVWKERLLIKLFNTNISEDRDSNGYNSNNGGDGIVGHVITEEQKAHMRESQIKTPIWKQHISEGRKKAKITAWNKGLKMSDEWKSLHPNMSPIRWDSNTNPSSIKVEYNGVIYPSKSKCWEENFSEFISYDKFKSQLRRISQGKPILQEDVKSLHLEDIKTVIN